MFWEIMKTLTRVVMLFFYLMLAFSLAFHALMLNQVGFFFFFDALSTTKCHLVQLKKRDISLGNLNKILSHCMFYYNGLFWRTVTVSNSDKFGIVFTFRKSLKACHSRWCKHLWWWLGNWTTKITSWTFIWKMSYLSASWLTLFLCSLFCSCQYCWWTWW